MARPVDGFVSPTASLLVQYSSTASISYRAMELPLAQCNSGRVLIFKEASEIPGPSVFAIRPGSGNLILESTMLFLHSNESVTLQASTGGGSNSWGILAGYSGVSSFSTQVEPVASQIINPAMTMSQLFVDLRTQSKTIVLPTIATLFTDDSQVPIYTIKDTYGMANMNTLYISTSYNDTLERSSIHNSIGITQAYASIDLAASRAEHKWHILNYYNGSLVSNP